MQLTINRVVRYILFIAVVMATLYFLFLVKEVVFSFALAALLAYLMFRPVVYIEKKGISRIFAILLLYSIVLGVIILVAWLAMPRVVTELSSIAAVMPEYADQAYDLADRVQQMDLPHQVHQVINENTVKLEQFIYQGIKGFVSGLYKFLSKILILIFAPILAFYILKDWEKIRDAGLNLLAPSARGQTLILFREMDQVVYEFIKGHLLVAVAVGILTGLAAFIIGVRFALLIGIVAGITNLVPYFGPILGGIPAVALALTQSSRLAIYMTLAIIMVQQAEANIMVPKIIGDRLGLHPLLIVFALMAGGELMGVWGMLLAVPVTGVLKVLINFAFFKMMEYSHS